MIILCGQSASGKTEIAKLLEAKFNLKKVITHTTRPIRVNEVNDVDYHFVTKDEFLSLISKNEFVEYATYNGNYYGSSKKEIGINKCAILEPSGVESYIKLNDPSIVIFFLTASKETRKKRMELRQDKEEDIIKRLLNDEQAFDGKESLADFIINTENKNPLELTQEIYKKYLSKIN